MSVERFDHIIKQKLEHIDVDTSNMNWDVFKSTMEAAAFDQSIAEQLSDMQPEIPAMDWNGFKSKMDAGTDAFDAKIKEKVDALSPDVPPMNWAKMKDDIDLDFDQKVVDLVDKSNPTLQQDHWPLLRDKMITQQQNKNARYTIKLIEAAAVLALFFLFNLGYNHFNNQQNDKGIVKIETIDSKSTNKATDTVVKKPSKVENQTQLNIEEVDVVSASPSSHTRIIKHVNPAQMDNDILSESKSIEDSNQRNLHFAELHKETNVVNNVVKPSNIQDARTLLTLEPIANISTQVVSYSNHDYKIEQGYAIVNHKEKKSPRYVELSYGAMGNQIVTPYDDLYRVNGAQLSSTNAMLSVLFSKTSGRWEYFTGFNYGLIKYNPKKVEELVPSATGELNQAYALSDIRLEKFTLNTGLRYTKMYGDHAVYAMGGLNTHMITSTKYTIKEYENNTINSLTVEDVPSNTILEQKNFHKGLLNGGNIRDNIHISAGIGIGYRYNINEKLDLFSQVRYNHNVFSNGVGPNRDKINSTSTDIGIRFKL